MKHRSIIERLSGTVVVIGVIAALNGCKSIQYPGQQSDRLRQDIQLARQETSMCRRQIAELKQRNTLLQQDYSTLATRFTNVEQKLQQQQQANLVLSRKLTQLNQMLQQEINNRNSAMQTMAHDIAIQTAKVINRSRRTPVSSTGSVPANCYKYRVQRGATLSAIAKAYKVKISDIRRVNHLKNDHIRAGQILYIPKK